MVQSPDEVWIETYDGSAVTLTDDLRALYAAVYAERPTATVLRMWRRPGCLPATE